MSLDIQDLFRRARVLSVVTFDSVYDPVPLAFPVYTSDAADKLSRRTSQLRAVTYVELTSSS